MEIREYRTTDCEELAKLFYNTVHWVNAQDYTKEQLNAWATGNVNMDEWNRSFLEHYTVVVVENGIIVGFGDMDNTGYLDRLYVHKDYQRQGIATVICHELESQLDIRSITTHASITSKPFFEKRGYRTIKEQQVKRNGQVLVNYIMKKVKKI